MRDIFYCICRYGANKRRLQSEIWCISVQLDIAYWIQLCVLQFIPALKFQLQCQGHSNENTQGSDMQILNRGWLQGCKFRCEPLVLWMNFYAWRTIGFWMLGRKSYCEGFILAEFSTFQRCISLSMVVFTHPECTKTHCFEFEELKLLWSFGLVRKAEFSLSFHGVFEVGMSQTGFSFYKFFLFFFYRFWKTWFRKCVEKVFGNYLYYIPENYIFVLKDSLDLSEFFIDNMMTSAVLHRIGPHHCRGCVVCDLRRWRLLEGIVSWATKTGDVVPKLGDGAICIRKTYWSWAFFEGLFSLKEEFVTRGGYLHKHFKGKGVVWEESKGNVLIRDNGCE